MSAACNTQSCPREIVRSFAVRVQGVLRLAAVVGIKEVLQLAGLEEEHLADLERFASENKRHHKGFHAWTFGRKSSTVRGA